ncbi:MAG: 23S rRNA (uracil(1939)-C(5))-methyltransferase RlmD [Gemmatimonadota bacterium]|nr:23S rRNA (uracil(1939)-C(5))-methyltransferase RlmD [Gemmatimonadota bacterium]
MNAGKKRQARRAAVSATAEQIATMTIDRIAKGGDGVGRANGLACFVPRTAPGDVAQVAYVAHARHGRGRLLQVLTPSPLRVPSTCVHYERDRCGGCQLQHLTDEAQRDARRHIVQDALSRIGKRDVALPELVSGDAWGYRGRLTLMLLPRGRSWIGGLHPHDDAARVFNLDECPIANAALVRCWHEMRERLHGLPSDRFLRVSFRLLSAEVGVETVAAVVQGGTEWPGAVEWAGALLRVSPQLRSVWWVPRGGQPRGLAGDVGGDVDVPEPETMEADDASDAGRYEPDAREALAFAQVNPLVATALRAYVHDAVRTFTPTTVIDAYAGSGVLSESLARDGAAVVAIEADPSGTAAARRRLEAAGLGDRVRVVTGLVESVLASALPADVVVLNPPRVGVSPGVTAVLADAARRGVRGIVYVSCDPATLARDLARVPGWRIVAMRCFDMFPQTAHVETVCVLRPEAS